MHVVKGHFTFLFLRFRRPKGALFLWQKWPPALTAADRPADGQTRGAAAECAAAPLIITKLDFD